MFLDPLITKLGPVFDRAGFCVAVILWVITLFYVLMFAWDGVWSLIDARQTMYGSSYWIWTSDQWGPPVDDFSHALKAATAAAIVYFLARGARSTAR